MRANQLRLYFASFAYVLMHALRRLGTQGTQFARAQCSTLRLKLLKVGVRVKITVEYSVQLRAARVIALACLVLL